MALGVFVMALHTPLNILSPDAYNLHSNTGHDFRLMYSAAHVLTFGGNPYTADVFLRQAIQDGLPRKYLLYHGQLGQPYVYPPIFAWFLMPLTLLGPANALLLWRVFSVMLVFLGSLGLIKVWAASVKPARLQSPVAQVLLATIIAVAPLTTYAVYWGNPVVIVYAAMGGWIYALHKEHMWWDRVAGILMSVSLLKPQLALPLAVIAVACLVRGVRMGNRLRNITLGFGAAIIVFLILDVLVTPSTLLLAWPKAIAHLSQAIALQPDMPSLYGLVKYVAPRAARYNIVYIGIAIVGGVITTVLAIRLRDRWQPTTLLGMLTVVWCFTTPYGHGNDQLLLVPGGLALIMAYIAPSDEISAVSYSHPQLFKGPWLVAMGAILALWLGSLPILLHYHSYTVPGVFVTVAPLLLVVAFTATAVFQAPLIAVTLPNASVSPHNMEEAPDAYDGSMHVAQARTKGV